MAVAAAGSLENVELGFAPQHTAVISIAGTTVGYIESDVSISVPREYAFVRAALTPIKHIATSKNMTVSFPAKEIVLEHCQYAWDGDAAATSVLTINEDMGATVALLVKTYAPNSGSVATPANEPISRVVSIPKALATGDGAYNIPKASSGDTNQSISFDFIALGDTASNELLGTVTDSYT
jgi:hypothetical protein